MKLTDAFNYKRVHPLKLSKTSSTWLAPKGGKWTDNLLSRSLVGYLLVGKCMEWTRHQCCSCENLVMKLWSTCSFHSIEKGPKMFHFMTKQCFVIKCFENRLSITLNTSLESRICTLQIYTAGIGTHVKSVKVTSICHRYYHVKV